MSFIKHYGRCYYINSPSNPDNRRSINVSVLDNIGGSVFGGGDTALGTLTTVIAIPAEGFEFDGWYEGETKVSENASYTFTVESARTLVGKFLPIIMYEANAKLPEVSQTNQNGLHVNSFNSAITSHIFENGVGKITFDRSVTSIGDSAFRGCSNLTSVSIPNSVTSIGDWAFKGCSGLTSVTIPNSVTSIGNDAFYGCSGLTSITIPNSVTSIGKSAFAYCSGLTSVTIGNSVSSIGDYAFSHCSGLASITIPNSVTDIGDGAFSYCSGLTSVTIPNSVTSINNIAFYGCSGLTSVTLNSNTIASKTYTSSENVIKKIFGEQVTEFILGDDVKSIGDYAFYGFTNLTSITIPNSVKSIGSNAFDGTGWFANQPDGLVYAGLNVYRYKGTMPENTAITIKDGTHSICSGAFYNCSGLTSVTIGDSVTSIGDNAFKGCSDLTSLTIPNSVETIGDYAFSGCSGLASIIIPNSVTDIGRSAFYECSGLTSVTIPNNVTSIGSEAFSRCSGLASIKVASGNTKYDSRDNCNAIIETASNTLVYGCKNTIIPNSVTSIGQYAFSYCYSLTSITIPNSVTSIGNYAFSRCSGLTRVICKPTTPPTLGLTAFDSNASGRKIYVPSASVDTYKAAERWSTYAADIEAIQE